MLDKTFMNLFFFFPVSFTVFLCTLTNKRKTDRLSEELLTKNNSHSARISPPSWSPRFTLCHSSLGSGASIPLSRTLGNSIQRPRKSSFPCEFTYWIIDIRSRKFSKFSLTQLIGFLWSTFINCSNRDDVAFRVSPCTVNQCQWVLAWYLKT